MKAAVIPETLRSVFDVIRFGETFSGDLSTFRMFFYTLEKNVVFQSKSFIKQIVFRGIWTVWPDG